MTRQDQLQQLLLEALAEGEVNLTLTTAWNSTPLDTPLEVKIRINSSAVDVFLAEEMPSTSKTMTKTS